MHTMPVTFEHSCGKRLLRKVTCCQATGALSYLTGSKAVAAACQAHIVKQLQLWLMLIQHTAYSKLLVDVPV